MREQSKWYPQEIREKAVAMWLEGQTVPEIAEALGVPEGTVFEWTRNVQIPPEIEQAKKERCGKEKGHRLGLSKAKSDDLARRTAYEGGYGSQMTSEDRVCVGFYAGDGAKYPREFGKTPQWRVTNAERCYIRLMIQWAIRRGHKPAGFGATIHIHPGVKASEDELRTHWAEVGIPAENIGFLRTKSPGRNRSSCNSPWGTCNLYATDRNGVELFWFMRGQTDQLSENPDEAHRATLALLDALHQKEMEQREKSIVPSESDSSVETELDTAAQELWDEGSAA